MDTDSLVSIIEHLLEEQLDAVIMIQTETHEAYFHINRISISDLHFIIDDGEFQKSIALNLIKDAKVYRNITTAIV